MEQIKISAKNLGQVALEDFCERCFWIKLKTANKLPWQIFPGIFSSIDAYTKKCAHALLDQGFDHLPWLKDIGGIARYHKTPHHTKFKTDFPGFGITLNGITDDIFELTDGSFVIPDYKTAKYTANQDKLLPLYAIQLNGYKAIAEATGFDKVSSLWLVYFEPATDEEDAKSRTGIGGFSMAFTAKPVQVAIDRPALDAALQKTREIYDATVLPKKAEGCKDCDSMSGIIDLLAKMPPL
uniref:Putative PD-(D/E)XK nuclease superfamily protein n=1 Tax=viral metagenome TaxID=1070528 RepID=A0A6M3IRX0_9ZZZZ